MSKIIFTEDEIELLSKNKYVKKVSEKGITYTDEFKRIFVLEKENGRIARDIFEEYGFDYEILGSQRIRSAGTRWCKDYRENGVLGLQDTRKNNKGRLNENELSLEEKYKRLEAQNHLLKAENELLKKLDMIERRGNRKDKS